MKLGQYKGLSAPRPTAELSDDDVNAAVEEYLQNHLIEEHPEKAAMGDEVVLDFEGFVNGVPCSVVRMVSDASNGAHQAEYQQFADGAAKTAAGIIWKFLEKFGAQFA